MGKKKERGYELFRSIGVYRLVRKGKTIKDVDIWTRDNEFYWLTFYLWLPLGATIGITFHIPR